MATKQRDKYYITIEELLNGNLLKRFQLNSECVAMKPSYSEAGRVSDWNERRASG